tara:strand:- start:148 stop:1002 length:855 start_codon:yes stop_codon:yes gene_type:complete
MIKKINYFIQAIIIYFLFFLSKLIGLSLSRKVFSKLFLIFGKFFKSEKIIQSNLEIYSKNLTQEEKKRIISNMWKNYGMTFAEYVYLNYFKKSNVEVEIEGEKILKLIKENKKSIIFVSGHFANFELMAMEITKKEIELAAIYRPLNNIFLNPYMEYLRKKYICKNQIKKGINGVREAIEYIKKDHSIALMIDQRVSEGEKINFFGKPAYTTTLPAQLAIKYNLKIIPVFIRRINKKFKIYFGKEINSSDFKNKIDLTVILNKKLEEMVQKNPDQWIWTHNRWK